MFAIVLLQVLHVHWVETSRVLGVIYVLAEGRETVGFINESTVTFGVDEVPCIIRVAAVTSRRTSMVTFIPIPRPGLATRVVALICFLVALLFSRGSTVVGNKRGWVLSPDLTQGNSGQALNFMNLRSVRQGLHQYSCLGQVDKRTVESIVGCFVQVLL